MKTKFLLVVVLAVVSTGLAAQIPGFALKVMGGINENSFKIPDYSTEQVKAGYAFSLDAALGKKRYLQGGISLRQYRSRFQQQNSVGDLQFNSFNFHVFYGFRIIDAKVFQLRGFTGPAYELYDHLKVKDLNLKAADFNSSAVMFAFGLEAKIAMILVSLQWEPSFTDISTLGHSKASIFVAKVGLSLL